MKPVLLRSDRGFVLPLTVGVGAILMLLGAMMIIRSSQGDRSAIAAKFNSRSQSVAEGSLTTFQSLMNRYKALSSYTYCSANDPVSTVDPNCSPSSPPTKTWSNVSHQDFCGTQEKDGQLGKYYEDLVKDYSNDFFDNSWQIQDGGKFRLVRYIYSATPPPTPPVIPPMQLGSGQLLVESEIEQDTSASSVNTPSKNPKTRLEIGFENWLERVTDANILPALWISSNGSSGTITTTSTSPATAFSTSTTPGFSIWDSTPSDNCAHDKAKQLRDRLNSSDDTYRLIPDQSFPGLPSAGNTTPTVGTGVHQLISIQPSSGSSFSLPRSTDSLNGDQVTYITPILDLNNAELRINSRTNLKTVILHITNATGDLFNVRNGGKITVDSGVELKIYYHASSPISIESDGSTPAITSDTPVQIYNYTNNPITISGESSNPLQLFIFSPRAQVRFLDQAKITGAVWAQSWVGDDDIIFARQVPTDIFSQVTVNLPRIRPISSWRRCTVVTAPECPESR
jgi:hypothetical protein